jgi:hypothetical protein
MTLSAQPTSETHSDFFISRKIHQDHSHKSPLVQEYWSKGYIFLRGLFRQEEVRAWSDECDRLLKQDWVVPQNMRTPFNRNSIVYPERIDPVVDASPLFQDLVRDQRIVDIIRDIFDATPILFKDKLIFKAPGVHGYTLHQDQAWWQLCPADDILSVSIQIDGANADNGCIELVDTQHDRMRTPIGVNANFDRYEDIMEEFAQYECKKMETIPGDVLIFHSLAPHCSSTNVSDSFRRSLYLTYNSESSGNHYQKQWDQYIRRLQNVPPYEFYR